ncbi:HORMA domain-containing protein 1 [Astathelohania contejeani]|uniref:HORMA domain-containing protein 1 n=1 Tax=Astathelohania contejeani TaxID=164912 RepID=A0ABQ7HXI7_9MICR|nr:HORMA domain-containing protein 1 [Thelohania contejeani]
MILLSEIWILNFMHIILKYKLIMHMMQIKKQEQSVIQIKKLLQTTLSTIAYLRKLFPSEHFEETTESIKRLRRTGDTNVSTFIDWFEKGCADAIDKKYLKSVIVAIYLDSKNPEEVAETYTFDIDYTENKETEIPPAKIMNTLEMLVQTLRPLPPIKYVTLKLFYFDYTPRFYEPPGFKAADNHSFQFKAEPLKLDIGNLRGESASLKIHTEFDYKHKCTNKNNTNECTNENNTNESINENNINECINENNINECTNENNTFISNTINNITKPQIINHNTNFLNKKDKIKCICGINVNDSDMLQCDRCLYWNHTVCCGFFSNTDKRIPSGDYICITCLFTSSKKLNYYKKLGIMRRCLSIIYNENINNPRWLSNRMGISLPHIRNLIRRLINEGFVSKSKEGALFVYKVMKNSETKIKIKQYFSLNPRDIKASIPLKDLKCK